MTGTAVTVRILAKTAAEQQYGVSREIRERVKAALDEAGVQGPPSLPSAPRRRRAADPACRVATRRQGLAPSFERLPR